MVGKGRQLQACPYYSSRAAVPSAQLVTLPYNLLLHKDMRDSLGISLQGNAIVIDEAHNLIESINSMYSVRLASVTITEAHRQLSLYHERYHTKLNASNLENVETLLRICNSFLQYLTKQSQDLLKSSPKAQTHDDMHKQLCSINDFVFTCGIDDINLFQLEKFFERTEITKKLQGFAEHQEMISPTGIPLSSVSAMSVVRSFLQALTNTDADGRIISLVSSMFTEIPSSQTLTLHIQRNRVSARFNSYC